MESEDKKEVGKLVDLVVREVCSLVDAYENINCVVTCFVVDEERRVVAGVGGNVDLKTQIWALQNSQNSLIGKLIGKAILEGEIEVTGARFDGPSLH